jgi:hypothetical protein
MQIAENHFRIAVLGGAALLMLLLGTMRFCGEFSLPGKPPAPAVSAEKAASIAETIKLSSAGYDSYLKEDVASFGLRQVLAREMSTVFPYRADQERHVMEAGDTIDVLDLTLTLAVEKVKGSKRDHMILTIENKSHMSLAYRVQTNPSSGKRSCKRMAYLPHNALALPPGGKAIRAECVHRSGWNLEITEVETVQLPELGFHYVSALAPDGVGLEPRTSRRHKSPHKQMSCPAPTSAALRNAIASGDVAWRDLIDFFARHRCKTYKFPRAYQAFRKDGQITLPVKESDL